MDTANLSGLGQHTHANESFRIVQLSDPHLSRITLPNPLQLCNKRILGYLSWLKKRRHYHQLWVLDACLKKLSELQPDHVVISGDMTHIGLPSEFDQVRQWLEQHFDARNTTVIPGNHDLYVREKWNPTFAKWKNFMCSDDNVREQLCYLNDFAYSLDDSYPILRLRSPVALIGLSSVYPAGWGMATGMINDSQLDRLQQLLQDQQLSPYVKIILIHHPPLDHTLTVRKSLLQSSRLLQLLQSSGIDLILHGHGHCAFQQEMGLFSGRSIPVVGCPSCSSTEQLHKRQAEFYLFEVQTKKDSVQIIQEVYRLNHIHRQFEQIRTNDLVRVHAA